MLKRIFLVTFCMLINITGCGRVSDYVWEHGGCTVKDGQDCEREQDNEEVGPTGPQGPMGSPGAVGESGKNGTNGEPGPEGVPGNEGAAGRAGTDGTDGTDGEAGIPGTDGGSCTIELRYPVVKGCGTEWRQILVCPDSTEADVGKVCA